jgi:hypothetical protein
MEATPSSINPMKKKPGPPKIKFFLWIIIEWHCHELQALSEKREQ